MENSWGIRHKKSHLLGPQFKTFMLKILNISSTAEENICNITISSLRYNKSAQGGNNSTKCQQVKI
jgi:hypothetical protein